MQPTRPYVSLLRLLSAIVVISLSIAASYWYSSNVAGKSSMQNVRSNQAPTSSPAMHPHSVHALGRLEPDGTILSLFPASGNEGACVTELLVCEGQDVTEGELLATMDTYHRKACTLAEADAALQASKTRLKQIEAGAKQGDILAAEAAVQLASDQVQVAKREMERAKQLKSQNAIAEEEMDSRTWSFDRAVRELSRLEGVLQSTKEVRGIDVAVQRAQVSLSESVKQSAIAHLEATQLKAPCAGRVLKIHTRLGEKPSSQGIIDLGNVLQMQAVAEVYEGDIDKLEMGQAALIRLDSLARPLHGSIVEIGNMVARKVVLTNDPVSDTDARIVEVRVAIVAEDVSKVIRMSNARVEVHFQ
jgi:HlyD family secretion protein